MEILESIRKKLIASKGNWDEVSYKSKISRRTFSNIVNKKTTPDLATLDALDKYFKKVKK